MRSWFAVMTDPRSEGQLPARGSRFPSSNRQYGVGVTTDRRSPVDSHPSYPRKPWNEYAARVARRLRCASRGNRFRIVPIALLLAACSSTPAATVGPPATVAGTFDLAAVRANFEEECEDPIVVTEEFCEQVKSMTADGTSLQVRTTLEDGQRDEAEVICNLFLLARFDIDGKPLGYDHIAIRTADGTALYSCWL